MSDAPSPVKYTYEDLQTFPEGDGYRYEIIDGDLLVTPSPMSRHQMVLGNLYWWVRSCLEENPIGKVLFAPADVVFSQINVVEPDLLFLSNARLERLTKRRPTSSPHRSCPASRSPSRECSPSGVYR